jgi:hypothetical protein
MVLGPDLLYSGGKKLYKNVKKECFLKIALKTEENYLKQCESVPERRRVLEGVLLIIVLLLAKD